MKKTIVLSNLLQGSSMDMLVSQEKNKKQQEKICAPLRLGRDELGDIYT